MAVVRYATGSIGGNADGGSIYGELAEGSMQEIVNVLKTPYGLKKSSRFIDLGSGLAKPSFHVATVSEEKGLGCRSLECELSRSLARHVDRKSDACRMASNIILCAGHSQSSTCASFTVAQAEEFQFISYTETYLV